MICVGCRLCNGCIQYFRATLPVFHNIRWNHELHYSARLIMRALPSQNLGYGHTTTLTRTYALGTRCALTDLVLCSEHLHFSVCTNVRPTVWFWLQSRILAGGLQPAKFMVFRNVFVRFFEFLYSNFQVYVHVLFKLYLAHLHSTAQSKVSPALNGTTDNLSLAYICGTTFFLFTKTTDCDSFCLTSSTLIP